MPYIENKIFPAGCTKEKNKSSKSQEKSDWTVADIFSSVKGLEFTLAAPSWIIPDTAAENCRYLKDRVDEVCLLFFETQSCLEYGEEDLPEWLCDTGLRFHTHLPLDLDWNKPVTDIYAVIKKLVNKVAFLDPGFHVLHPPVDSDLCRKVLPELAEIMKADGIDRSFFLFENIKGNDLYDIVDVLDACGYGICFDLGHFLAYFQSRLMNLESLWDRVGMVHLNAPGAGSRHEPLTMLDDDGVAVLDELLGMICPGTVITVEVFEEHGFVDSLFFLSDRIRKNRGCL